MQAVITYFQQHYALKSLGEITWAHAVNSQARLRETLHNPQVMFLETDISRAHDGEIITAHPPARTSDLRFAELLNAVAQSRQGLKLDFKDPQVLVPCLNMLRESGLHQPVLLNADVLQGNLAGPARIEATSFLALCHELYPQGLLSIGWTTSGNPTATYTSAHIEEMVALCQRHAVQQATFPIRGMHAPASWSHVPRLLTSDNYTLTIWGQIDTATQAWLHQHTDPQVTCYDCFDEQGRPLRIA
ncbi:MAG: DUF2181 domain-containing protein [Ktedonobacteraceae bacterium]|nr:DUF2181 domain-containing protein [Ktedonobacteraceae bacterium]